MSLTKSLIVLLSVLLCFCLLSKQADQGSGMDYDVPTLVDVSNAESDNKQDVNEPALLGQLPSSFIISILAEPVVLGNFYRQPTVSPPPRPPAA